MKGSSKDEKISQSEKNNCILKMGYTKSKNSKIYTNLVSGFSDHRNNTIESHVKSEYTDEDNNKDYKESVFLIKDRNFKNYTPTKGSVIVIRHFKIENVLKDNYKVIAEKLIDNIKNIQDYMKLVFVPLLILKAKFKIKILIIEDYYNENKKFIELFIYGIRDTYKTIINDKSITRIFILEEDQSYENQEKDPNIQFEIEKDEIMELVDGDSKVIVDKFEREFEKSADTYRLSGYLLNAVGDYHGAIDMYNKIIELDPKNSYAYNYIGYNYLIDLENPKVSIDYFVKAIKIDPENFKALNNLGCAYY